MAGLAPTPRPHPRRALALAAALASALTGASAAADPMAEAAGLEAQAITAEVAAQRRIDQAHQETRRLSAEAMAMEQQLEQTRAYRRQLARLVAAQRAQERALQAELAALGSTETATLPMLVEMVDTLARFVELDLPFRQAARRAAAAELRALLDDPEVGLAEKYRRIMAAYQEEARYGTTLETYRDRLQLGGGVRAVELLRVGRIALIYRTPDAGAYGAWDPAVGAWVTLPPGRTAALRTAFRVADKQMAPELLRLPVPAPEGAP